MELSTDTAPDSPDDNPDDTPVVAVIVINWNGWRDTAVCIRSLSMLGRTNTLIVVVDNASSDDSLEQLKSLKYDFKLIESPANLGFAGGCNLGARVAQDLGADYLFFLNNDAFVEATSLSRLLETSYQLRDDAVLGPLVRHSPSKAIQFLGSRQSPIYGTPEWYSTEEMAYEKAPELIESDFIFGAALFIPAGIWKKVGDFDERYFLNYEETDWCYRAREQGHKSFVLKSAVVYHKGSASIGGLESPLQIYFMQRNSLLFCRTYGTPRQRWRSYRNAANHIYHRFQVARKKFGLRAGLVDPPVRARLLGLQAYLFGSFGDCPEVVRKLALKYKELIAEEELTQGQGN
jgi:GT2 family glycosyltransferase